MQQTLLLAGFCDIRKKRAQPRVAVLLGISHL
jgi:hypothetical protein